MEDFVFSIIPRLTSCYQLALYLVVNLKYNLKIHSSAHVISPYKSCFYYKICMNPPLPELRYLLNLLIGFDIPYYFLAIHLSSIPCQRPGIPIPHRYLRLLLQTRDHQSPPLEANVGCIRSDSRTWGAVLPGPLAVLFASSESTLKILSLRQV